MIRREGETGVNGTVRHGGITTTAQSNSNTPLKQRQLSDVKDFSKREGSRPLGDEYADIKHMIDTAVSSAAPTGPTVSAGTGLTLTESTLSVNNSLSNVTAVGTLATLTVDGESTLRGATTVTGATTMGDLTVGGVATVTGATTLGNVTVGGTAAVTGMATLGDAVVTGYLRLVKSFITPMQYFAAADGDTVTATALSPGIVLNPTGPLATLTIVLPATPLNGQQVSILSSQDVAAVTITASFANGNAPAAGLTAGTPLRYIWSSDAAAWFRV